MKNKILIYTLIIILIFSSLGANDTLRVWIYFKDKEQIDYKNIEDIAKQFLTIKSIERRSQKNNPIKYDLSDLPVNKDYIQNLKKNGVKIIHKSKWLNAVSAILKNDEIKNISDLYFVKKITPVKSFTFKQREIKDEVFLSKVTDFDYGDSFTQNNMHGIPVFHKHNYNGNGVLIAMFDTGFKTSHEAFDSLNVLHTWDFVENDNDVTGYPGDAHGTKTLGVIAGYSPGNLISPAYKADYLLAKTDDWYTETHRDEDNWVAAAEWADSLGADIISTSVGYNLFDTGVYDYTYEDMDGNTAITTIAADFAVKKGIAVFSTAGNEGSTSWKYILAPADGDSVFAIGNVTSFRTISPSSSRGPTFDGRIKPDFVAMGTNVYTVSSNNNNSFVGASGTSFSTPLAAGIGAILLSYNNSLNPMQLYNLLKKYSSNSVSPNNEMGYGIINIAPILGTGNSKISPINISRNPFCDYINISLDYYSDKKINIYNALGQKVKSFDENTLNFTWYGYSDNKKKVASGIYFIVMMHNNSTYAKKIILIH